MNSIDSEMGKLCLVAFESLIFADKREITRLMRLLK